MSERYTAAICMKGHFVDVAVELNHGTVAKFCTDCGAPVMFTCPNCSSRLLGVPPGYYSPRMKPDSFCSECGMPYPWANREAIISHLKNLLLYNNSLDQAQQLEVIEKLAILATPEKPERDRVDAGKKIKSLVPSAWAVAMPVLQSVLTAEIRVKLGLPPN